MIYFKVFQFNRKDRATLLNSLSQEKHRDIVENLELIDETLIEKEDATKFKRRLPVQSNDEHIEFKRLRAQSEYDVLRIEPRLCTLLK